MDTKGIFENKTILITGGTGFIGRSLISRLLKEKVHSIRIFSRDEVKHHNVQEQFKDKRLRFLVGDVRDYERLKKALHGCDIVIHAAAMKRIDLIEYNVEESIKTNILGTLNVINACLENNIEKAIYISTDKACSPINTYGAGKFIGERIFIESNFNRGVHKTIFSCVRYGNVLESTGSLIPILMQKMKEDSDLTLTDPKMTRFFITKEEAVDLIFNAAIHSVGGEVFVPKLESFNIQNLIEILKEFYNYNREIINIGIRPGEKIHEAMINEYESKRAFDCGNFFVISSEIEKYQPKTDLSYLNLGKKVNFSEYNSKNFVAPKEKILEKLKIMGVL
jgi:FlaA1/EpsC-like NDP-sugar epimerase